MKFKNPVIRSVTLGLLATSMLSIAPYPAAASNLSRTEENLTNEPVVESISASRNELDNLPLPPWPGASDAERIDWDMKMIKKDMELLGKDLDAIGNLPSPPKGYEGYIVPMVNLRELGKHVTFPEIYGPLPCDLVRTVLENKETLRNLAEEDGMETKKAEHVFKKIESGLNRIQCKDTD